MNTQHDSWVISDTHFSHAKVIIYDDRPFKTAKEMDEKMIENWNSVVKPNDTIYHLGDFAFFSENMVCKILDRLNGKIHLTGNCHGNYTYPEECRAMDVGAPCIDYTPINLNEVINRLSKFPSTRHH